MKISFEKRLVLFFAIIFIGIIVLAIVVARTNRTVLDSNKSVIHTKDIVAESELVLSLSEDIVMGSLQYVITTDSSLTDKFHESAKSVFEHIGRLREFTKEDTLQQEIIDSLNSVMNKRIELSDQYLKIRDEKGFDATRKLIATGEGKYYTDEIRRLIIRIVEHERRLLVERQKANNISIANFNRAFYALLVSALIFLLFIFYYVDLSFRKRAKAQKELKETNHFLDAILENIPNMIFVKDANELRFVRFNRAGEQLLGYSRNDLIGKNDYDFFPKDQADFFTGKDQAVIAKGELLDIPEEPINTARGEFLLHTKKIPIRDEYGKPVYLLGISEDITDQKKAEQHLKDLNERFLRIFNLGPVAMSISNYDDGKITVINETFERLFLIKKEDAIGKSFADLNIRKPEERVDILQQIEKSEGHIRETELRLRKATGEMVDALVSVEVIEIENKKFLLSAAMDITEQKKAEEQIIHLNSELEKNLEQLQLVNKELEAFTYSVSHDLRAPLRIIDGYIDILIQDFKEKLDTEENRMLELIKSNAHRMGQLIDDLLNLSRLGRKGLVKTKVDMKELVEGIMKEQTSNFSRPYEIKTGELMPANCDGNLIRQVWTNLISNAFKYSKYKDKVSVEIGCYKEGKEIIYFVKDHGAGFDMKYADKLFGVFQRLHKLTEFEGTGIGLALVQRIIAKHGGRVWAEAEVDNGATFYFSLPA